MTTITAYNAPAQEQTAACRYLASLGIRERHFYIQEYRAGDPQWRETGDYIGDCFHREYRARADMKMPRLIALRDDSDRIQAAVGLRDAVHGPLFLEQYLDRSIDQAVSEARGTTVSRNDLIEVGHLAGSGKGMSRFLFAALTALLTEWRYPWIAFTGTREVRRVFERLNLSPVPIRSADPACLPCGGANWGSYYEHDPVVMFGEVAGGHRTLRDHGVYRVMNLELNREFRHAVA